MNFFLLSTSLLVCGSTANAQYTEDFESPGLTPEMSWYGQDQITDGDTIYSNGPLSFELNYNSTWQSYSGFAVSNTTDTITVGSINQFSAIAGGGADGSAQYSVCYVSEWSNNRVFIDSSHPYKAFEGVKVTNTTFAYMSMLHGDSFGKPFGAHTNAQGVIDGTNGEDWFLLSIFPLDSDTLRMGDSINFYLADYRFADDADDYIVNSWETIDLTTFAGSGMIHGLDFELSSSDTTGGFGMNTPAYFALDVLGTLLYFGTKEHQEELLISTYPNPTNGNLKIEAQTNTLLQLYDLSGRLIKEGTTSDSPLTWNIEEIASGTYTLVSSLDGQVGQSKIVKR